MDREQPPDLAASLGRAAGRFSTDKALRKRLLLAGVSGAQTTLGSVGRVLRKLWHEVTGFLFVCLALIGAAEVFRKWHTHETQKLAAAAAFSVLFLYFGVSSFWRSRKRPRSTAETQRTRERSRTVKAKQNPTQRTK
jgi:hypothetical protein